LVLDAYIIERIKREQEKTDSDRVPLQKEPTPSPVRNPPEGERWEDRHRHSPDRGVVVIDM
jgi:hypothetical protein